MHSGLELQSRRRIYEFLSANPGVHLRRIGQTLGMSTGMLSYHLGVMERQGLLKSEAARHRRQMYRVPARPPVQPPPPTPTPRPGPPPRHVPTAAPPEGPLAE